MALGEKAAPSPEYGNWVKSHLARQRQNFATPATRPQIVDPDNTVTLYRGANNPPDEAGLAQVRPLSSWSDNPVIASGYGQHILKTKVPVDDVWAWHGDTKAFSGSNKAPEREWVIMTKGGKRPVDTIDFERAQDELKERMFRLHRPDPKKRK